MTLFNLPATQVDPLIAVMGKFRADQRADKIDLGVGVFRDDSGNTPIMAAVKEAERLLWEGETTKTYVGMAGDKDFISLLGKMVLGDEVKYTAGVQTAGGTGAVRHALELYKMAIPNGTIHVGLPSWGNHFALIDAVGINTVTYPYYSIQDQHIQFDDMCAALQKTKAGDAVLLHGCCHNPTGADLTYSQWQAITDILVERELVPVMDCAYHGLGQGMDEDMAGLRHILTRCQNAIIAISCSKNFGLYRERTGAVYYHSHDNKMAELAQGAFETITRQAYSMPPDHGASLVRIILQSAELKQNWQDELTAMRERITGLRASLAEAGHNLGLAALTEQQGMFSMLPLSPEKIDKLATDYAIYMAQDGRINIAGCREAQIEKFVKALAEIS
ncbi:MAG: amino acid aminotransferase [bacterium]